MIPLFFVPALYGQKLHLKVLGKTGNETSTIDSIGYTVFHHDYVSLNAALDTLETRINKIGYIEHQRIETKKENDSTVLALFHLKQKFNTIYIYHNLSDDYKTILRRFSENVSQDYFKVAIEKAEDVLEQLNKGIANRGFPFSYVKLSELQKKGSADLKANLVVDSTETRRRIGNIKIEGYTKFPKSYIKHYLKLRPGQVLDLSAVEKKTGQLVNLRFANQIKAPEVLFQKDSSSLFIYIEKTQSNTFDGFLGFGTNDETNRIEFDGFLNLRLVNNLNYGETFSLLYKSDEIDQVTFDATTDLPYIFGSPIGLDFNLRIFKKDTSFTTVDQRAKINYQINPLHKVSAGISSTTSNNLRAIAPTLMLQDYKTNYISLAYQYLNPQYYNILFPLKSKFHLQTNFGKRTSNTMSTNQSLLSISGFNNFYLNRKNSIYTNAEASILISDNFFDNELLRFGGINSIRGFEENSLFASSYGVLNTEYRYRLSDTIFVHSIIDFAYFENKILQTENKLYGFGFGFGIMTNSGLLKFNYANGKAETQVFKLSNSKVHISLVANF